MSYPSDFTERLLFFYRLRVRQPINDKSHNICCNPARFIRILESRFQNVAGITKLRSKRRQQFNGFQQLTQMFRQVSYTIQELTREDAFWER